jgi:hypothetical protein
MGRGFFMFVFVGCRLSASLGRCFVLSFACCLFSTAAALFLVACCFVGVGY